MKNLEIELQKKIVDNLQARLDFKLEAHKRQHKPEPAAENKVMNTQKNNLKADKDILKLAERLRIEMQKYLKFIGDEKIFEKFSKELWNKIK